MRLSAELFENVMQRLSPAGGGRTGLATREVAEWLESLRQLAPDFVEFLKHHSPKTEIWAGAGFIFDEATIMRRNTEFPEALQAGLFILGSAPNGDLIVLDSEKEPGAVGYLMHERMYSAQNVRSWYVPVCGSIGEFLSRINEDESKLPDDYFQAVALLKG